MDVCIPLVGELMNQWEWMTQRLWFAIVDDTDAWVQCAPMQHNRYYHGIAAVDEVDVSDNLHWVPLTTSKWMQRQLLVVSGCSL